MNTIQSAFRTWRMLVIRLFPEHSNHTPEFPELCLAGNPCPSAPSERSVQSILEDIIDKGFMWAAPKRRRSLERRMTRRMGYGKMILPKKNLVVCEACGHFHQVHMICGNCYEQVKKETEVLQEAVMKELKLDPIDKEVVILYENDSKEQKEFYEGKRIVELPKERPKWFSKNLMVKDSELPRKQNTSVKDSSFTPEVRNISD